MNTWLFDTSDFPPRFDCGEWQTWEGAVHILSNVAIFLAYAWIALSLRSKSSQAYLPNDNLRKWFSAFILLCAFSHLSDAILFYWPAYRMHGLILLGTAVVSLVTAHLLSRTQDELVIASVKIKAPVADDVPRVADVTGELPLKDDLNKLNPE